MTQQRRRGPLEQYLDMSGGGCWVWLGYVCPWTGYGKYGRKMAHRVSYELAVGPIPAGFQIDHLCRNRRCVNPQHLEAVSPRVNILRSMSPSAIVVRTNRCKRDHELTPENTYHRPDGGGRQCRECIRIRSARQTSKRRSMRGGDAA